jgi:hypothetical protein
MHIVKWKMWLKRLHSAWFQLPNSLRERQNYRDSETVKRVRGCQIWGWGCYTGIFFPTFGITRFYTQGFMLVRCSTASAMPPALLALVILETESHFLPRLAWTAIFLFYASCHCWDDRCAHHYDQLFSVFCPGWPGTTIQPISVSQVSMITRMSHWHPIYFLHYLFIYLLLCWDLNSGPSPWATPPGLFVMGIFKIGSQELFAWAGFDPWPSWTLPPEQLGL